MCAVWRTKNRLYYTVFLSQLSQQQAGQCIWKPRDLQRAAQALHPSHLLSQQGAHVIDNQSCVSPCQLILYNIACVSVWELQSLHLCNV